MTVKLLNGLNPNQKQAVTSNNNTILCLAGAGSGKTTVLTRRIAHLFDNRVGTSNMLALTFTRLAGKEMKERVISLIGDQEGKKLFCNTFHAFAVQVLKEWGHEIGIEKNFTIYDQEDREAILNNIINEFGGKTTLKKVLTALETGPDERSEEYRVIEEYMYRLRQNNAVDLDQLINRVVLLWNVSSESLSYYQQMYSHVFVDEFQDTNDEQMEMIKLLAPNNLFVVGDDFQAIYGWRGAKVDYIIDFPNAYKDCEVVKLEDNYRSTNQIVAAANNLISNNVNQTKKKLIAHKDGPKITVLTTGDERKEYEKIVDRIKSLNQEGIAYKDIAVLSRTNIQLARMQSKLEESGLPNVALGRNDIMRNSDVRSIVAWLEVITNHRDGGALDRALRYPKSFLTEIEYSKIKLKALKKDSTHLQILHECNFQGAKEFFLLGYAIFQKYKEENTSVSRVFEIVAEQLGVINDYEEKGLNNRIDSFNDALSYISSWEKSKNELGEDSSLSGFLKWLKHRDIHEKLVEEKDAVKLMTMHGSKGLEFDVVFLVGLVEDTFPSKRGDIEEERRLAYVGITRAKEQLFLSYPLMKQQWNGSLVQAEKSRFLNELSG